MSEHTAYRQTKEWKQFREKIVHERDSRCECCGIKKKGLNLHHLDPANYQDLDPLKFKLLCKDCHNLVEKMARRLHGSKADMIANKEKWLDLLGPFLPH
jgi:hypothetical protein